jgi:hypothetical protein
MRRIRSTLAAAVGMLILSVPCLAQQEERRSASLDGATGLFTVWDAEPLKSRELSLGLAASRYNRDPGQLRITGFPVAGSIGAFGFLEFFGALDAHKQIAAGSIEVRRVSAGEMPRPATSPLGASHFSNEALFIDVSQATGRGNLRGGVKINVLSERLDHPIALTGVIFGEVPTQWSYDAVNRGLSSRTIVGGVGALVSKRFDDVAQVHVNFRFDNVRSPRGKLSRGHIADVGHEFIYKAGVLLPNRGQTHFIAELDAKIHAGDRTPGLNPVNPVDLLLGLRLHRDRLVALSAGYRLSLNRIEEDPARQVFKRNASGFVVQLALGIRKD